MGLGVLRTGAGNHEPKMQSVFWPKLIKPGDAKHYEYDLVWRPVLGAWCGEDETQAAYMHGQDVMNAIFGKTRRPELFLAKNGLIVSRPVEKYFEIGRKWLARRRC
jgi:hypothetical protein